LASGLLKLIIAFEVLNDIGATALNQGGEKVNEWCHKGTRAKVKYSFETDDYMPVINIKHGIDDPFIGVEAWICRWKYNHTTHRIKYGW